jgi:signal transduction histidine kinase
MNGRRSEIVGMDLNTTVQLLQEELEATNREVMLLTLELEQRVAERTAELATSNQQLLKEVAERIRAESEIKKLNRDLANRADQLQAANEDLEAFASSVSHDLRNPLARILGFASLLEEIDLIPAEKRQRYVSQIADASRTMSALIDDLLRFARSFHVPLSRAPVDLNDLAAGVISELKINAASPVEWTRDDLPTVYGDASLLRQVFINILGNAVKFSRGQSPPRIEIRDASSSDEWIILVRDNGVGFHPSGSNRLFSAFQRLHDDEEFEGTGVGLSNVKRIVVRHGGKVWAESYPGEGASFYVSLPKIVADAGPSN